VEEDIAILELQGGLTTGPLLMVLHDTAKKLIEGNKLKGVIVEMDAVTLMDTAGLSELVKIYTTATNKGCSLRLVNVKPQMRKVLVMTRLDQLLTASADLASAKADIKKKR
jgi:anti-anti-sigma factor